MGHRGAVAEEWVGAIIGKGVGLKRISDETGCAIDYEEAETDESGEPSGAASRANFRIKSKWEDKCVLAQKRIEERLSLLQRLDVVSIVMVPKQCVGRLIGKGGSNIEALQRESGANRLSFDKEGGNRGHTQGCTIQTSDVADAIKAGMTVLEAVCADTSEAKPSSERAWRTMRASWARSAARRRRRDQEQVAAAFDEIAQAHTKRLRPRPTRTT